MRPQTGRGQVLAALEEQPAATLFKMQVPGPPGASPEWNFS